MDRYTDLSGKSDQILATMAINKRDKKSKIIWTSTVSQSHGAVAMKFRPPKETPREETKGKLPCAEATSVQQVT